MKKVIEHNPFSEGLKIYFEKSEAPTKEELVKIMKESKLHKVGSDTTYRRRAQTVLKWIEWILDVIDE